MHYYIYTLIYCNFIMRSANRNRPIQPLSFWDQLDEDIDQIGTRAKDKLFKYQQKQHHTLRQNPENKTTIKINFGRQKKHSFSKTNSSFSQRNLQGIPKLNRRELQKLQRDEDEKTQQMKNRLTYLKQNKQKQNKTIELAKKKFQQIVSIRTQTFKQKQAMRKKILSIQTENKSNKSLLVKEVKTSRQKLNLSMTNYKINVAEKANLVRAQTINNESFTAFEKVKSRQQNAKKAEKTKQSIQRSRSIVCQVQQKKIERAKSYRNNQIQSKLKALTQHKRNNQQIFNKLKSEAERIGKWKSRAQKQIQEYKSYLGMNSRVSQTLKKNVNESKGSLKSFYITSHV